MTSLNTAPKLSLKQRIKQSPIGPWAETLQDLFTRNGMYNRQTVQVMRRVLKSDSNCVDIGAHCGTVLRDIVALSPLGQHVAFEPLPHLSQNLVAQFPDVQVLSYALSNSSGKTTFQYVVNAPAYSGLRQRDYARSDVQIQEIEVEMARLDDVLPQSLPIALIKLDIEGGEYHALKGAIETVRRHQPIVVFEASLGSTGRYGVQPNELYQLIVEDMGYRISTMGNWLQGKSAYTIEAFEKNWFEGPEYYFIAYPQ